MATDRERVHQAVAAAALSGVRPPDDNLRPAHARCTISRGNGQRPPHRRLVPPRRRPDHALLASAPPDLWERPVAAARRGHRSLTLQLIHSVEEGLDRSEREQRACAVRERLRAAAERTRDEPRGG